MEDENKQASEKVVKKRIDNYVYNDESVIGKGQFGYVYQGYDIRTNEVVAIKVIPLVILQNKFFEYLLINEISALKKLKSPYIVRFIDLKVTVHHIYLITEFCDGGDLSSKLQDKGKVGEEEVLDTLWQVSEAFKEMKRFNMLHRDLKPPNILIHQGMIKLADLGFSKTVENFQISINNSTVGSPIYMSPQVLFKQTYTSKCDVWSLGILLYQLIYGKVPWHALDIVELANKIKNDPIIFHNGIQISNELKDLIIRCLRYEEAERISWEEVFDHPALKLSKLGQEKAAEPPQEPEDIQKMESEPKPQQNGSHQKNTGSLYSSRENTPNKVEPHDHHKDSDKRKEVQQPHPSQFQSHPGQKAPADSNKIIIATNQGEAVYARTSKEPAFVTSADVIPDPKSASGQQMNPQKQGQLPQMQGFQGAPGGFFMGQPQFGMMPGMFPQQPGMMGMPGMPGMQGGGQQQMPNMQQMQRPGQPGQGMPPQQKMPSQMGQPRNPQSSQPQNPSQRPGQNMQSQPPPQMMPPRMNNFAPAPQSQQQQGQPGQQRPTQPQPAGGFQQNQQGYGRQQPGQQQQQPQQQQMQRPGQQMGSMPYQQAPPFYQGGGRVNGWPY